MLRACACVKWTVWNQLHEREHDSHYGISAQSFLNILHFHMAAGERSTQFDSSQRTVCLCAHSSERVVYTFPGKQTSSTRDCAPRESYLRKHERHLMCWFWRHSHYAPENRFVSWLEIYVSNNPDQPECAVRLCHRDRERDAQAQLCSNYENERFQIKIMIGSTVEYSVFGDVNCDEWWGRGATKPTFARIPSLSVFNPARRTKI